MTPDILKVKMFRMSRVSTSFFSISMFLENLLFNMLRLWIKCYSPIWQLLVLTYLLLGLLWHCLLKTSTPILSSIKYNIIPGTSMSCPHASGAAGSSKLVRCCNQICPHDHRYEQTITIYTVYFK